MFTLYRKSPLKEDNLSTKDKNGWSRKCPFLRCSTVYGSTKARTCNVSDTNLCLQVVDYSGERTLDALIEYVEGQVSGETGDDTDTDSDDEGKEAEPEEVPLDKDEL